MKIVPLNGIKVVLSEPSLQNLFRSAVEVFPRETDGQLIGTYNPTRKAYHVDMSYPFQTSNRGFRWIDPGNKSATKRLVRLGKTLNATDKNQEHLGGYHSHPRKDSVKNPSEGDLEAFQELMEERGETSWLEIITYIYRERLLESPRKPVSVREHPRKIGFTVHDFDRWVYKGTVGAFLYLGPGEVYELKVNHNGQGNGYKSPKSPD